MAAGVIARPRGASRRRWRGISVLLTLAALLAGGLAILPAARDLATPGTLIGAETPFSYVAIFAPGTPGTRIEQWRGEVLRVHRVGCVGGRACVARSLRLSGVGPERNEVLAFDLMPDTPPDERRAIAAAALMFDPTVRLAEHSSARAATE